MSSTTLIDLTATTGILKLAHLDDDTSQAWSGFRLRKGLDSEFFALSKPEQPVLSDLHDGIFELVLEDTPLLDLDSPTYSSISLLTAGRKQAHEQKNGDEEVEDAWDFPDVDVNKKDNKLINWDQFIEAAHEEATLTFPNETGADAFDQLLHSFFSGSADNQMRYARPNNLISALFDLGLGRSSTMFQWSEQDQRFVEPVQSYSANGMNEQSLRHLVARHLDAGAQFRRLSSFGCSLANSSPTRIALQKSVLSILHSVEDVVEDSRHGISSLIELDHVYHRPFVVLALLERLFQNIASIVDDGDLVAAVVVFAEQVATEQRYFERVVNAVVAQILQPGLQYVEVAIGLRLDDRNVQSGEIDGMAAVLSRSNFKTMREASTTLELLQMNNSDSLILKQRSELIRSLRVEFSSDAIVSLEEQAKNYEQALQDGLVHQPDSIDAVHTSPVQFTLDLDKSSENPFCFKPNMFKTSTDRNAIDNMSGNDSIQHLTRTALVSKSDRLKETTIPCREAINLSLGPILTTQHRLLTYSILQILFRQQNLISHINLLNRFQFLSDGTFVSKLSATLFDSEKTGKENKRKIYAKTGLRLQSRRNWPPASSDLRLILMRILSESMLDIKDTALTNTTSFAIRDLSDEDFERCRDVDSVYALDFLRLHYNPPVSIMETILTSSCLEKYDRIFHYLLRLLRMRILTQSLVLNHQHDHKTSNRSQSVSSSLSTLTHRFAFESHSLMTNLTTHSHLNVIQPLYANLVDHLRRVSITLSQKDYETTLNLTSGLSDLHQLHDHTLDQILEGLFLLESPPQPGLQGTIESLFEVILKFATEISDIDEQIMTDTTRMKTLYREFRDHVKRLVSSLQSEIPYGNDDDDGDSDGKETDSDDSTDKEDSEGEKSGYEKLLLLIDWNGYWTKSLDTH